MRIETNDEGEKVKGRTKPSWRPDIGLGKTHMMVQQALATLGENTMREVTHTIRRAVARAYFDALVGEGYDFARRAASALAPQLFLDNRDKLPHVRLTSHLRDQVLWEDVAVPKKFPPEFKADVVGAGGSR